MASRRFEDSLLLLLVAALLTLHRLTTAQDVPAIACTQGMDSSSPVANGDVLNVRLGETLILKCQGDTMSIYSHFAVRDYPHGKDTIEANESSLSYTWYFVPMSNAPVEIWGFLRGESLEVKMLVQLNIRVHDLNLETATPNPCTPPEYTTTTAGDTQSANVDEHGQNGQQSTEASTTTDKANGGSPTANTAVTYAPYAIAVVLGILVILLLILVSVLAVKLNRKKNEASIAEEGKSIPRCTCVRGNDEQSSDRTSNNTVNAELHDRTPDNTDDAEPHNSSQNDTFNESSAHDTSSDRLHVPQKN